MATHFFWDPIEDNIVQERDDFGVITAEFATEPYLYGNLISQNRGGVESQYHFDPQGSTLALTDDNQQVTDTYAYSAFGEVTEHTGSTVNSFQYIGQKQYYCGSLRPGNEARRRDLDAETGRWLAVDPLRSSNPELNAYVYALNRPLTRIDPSGLKCICSLVSQARGKLTARAIGGIITGLSAYLPSTNPGVVSATPVTRILCEASQPIDVTFVCNEDAGYWSCGPLKKFNVLATVYEFGRAEMDTARGAMVVGAAIPIGNPFEGLVYILVGGVLTLVNINWYFNFDLSTEGGKADKEAADKACAGAFAKGGLSNHVIFDTQAPTGSVVTLPPIGTILPCSKAKKWPK